MHTPPSAFHCPLCCCHSLLPFFCVPSLSSWDSGCSYHDFSQHHHELHGWQLCIFKPGFARCSIWSHTLFRLLADCCLQWPMNYNPKQEEHSVTYTFLHLLFWVFPSEFPVISFGRTPTWCCEMSSGKEPVFLMSAMLKCLSEIFVLLVATWLYNNTMG